MESQNTPVDLAGIEKKHEDLKKQIEAIGTQIQDEKLRRERASGELARRMKEEAIKRHRERGDAFII